jgi:methylglyoxal synthase
VSGTFATSSTAGVLTGSITGLDVTTCQVYQPSANVTSCTADTLIYYFVDPTKAVALENDINQLTRGFFQLQQ